MNRRRAIIATLPEDSGLVCSWWVMCDRPATVLLEHPILGDVPTCAECAVRVGELS